jgi:ubiquinone biosynthesis protein COQ4
MLQDATVAAGNTFADQADFEDLSPVPPRPVQWRRARDALRELTGQGADPLNATYTVVDALGGMAEERLFQQFRKDPVGRRLLVERPDLPGILADHDRLISMPEGSLGRIYGDLCRRAGISSVGLVDSRRQMSRDYHQLDPARQWFVDRLTVLHDLWHILTGYATQPRGEAAIVAFSFGQGLTYRPVPVFMVLSVIMKVARPGELWRAFRRGRQTSSLIVQRYEDLLALPLATVRDRVKVPDGRLAHGPQPGEGLLA